MDLTTEEPIILRPGYITRQMLEQVLHKVNEDSTMMRDDSGQAPKAPEIEMMRKPLQKKSTEF